MYQSLQYSQLSIRIGIAAVFLYFGIEKFVEPAVWGAAWIPVWLQDATSSIGMSIVNVMILIGMFEVLVAASMLTGFFLRLFAGLAAVFILLIFVMHGINDVLIRDVSILAGLVALLLWPERHYS